MSDPPDHAPPGIGAIQGIDIAPDEAARTPASGPVGRRQRLRISVPNVRTDLTMGYRANEEELRHGWPSFDGFGVTTEGSIVMDAHNGENPTHSKIQLQATGAFQIQSEKNSIYMSAKEDTLIHTGKYGFVHGNHGLVLAGGVVGIEPAMIDKEGHAVPRDHEWLAAEKAALKTIKGTWSNAHNMHTGVEIAELLNHVYHHRRTMPAKALMWSGVHLTSAYIGAGWLGQGLPVVGGPTADLPLKGATYIHGSEYVVMGGGLSTAIFGGLGAAMASLGFTGLMGTDVAATAAHDLQLQAFGSATLFARKELETVCKEHVVLASRNSHLSIMGPHIRIGGEKDAKHHQHATDAIQIAGASVGIGAKEAMQVESDKDLHLKAKKGLAILSKGTLTAKAPKASIQGEQQMVVSSASKAVVRTDKYGMWVSNGELKIGSTAAKLPPRPDENPNWVYEGLAKEATELTVSNAKKFAEEKWEEWTQKAAKVSEKNSSITLKDGNIVLRIKGYKVTVDSGKAKVGKALVVKL